MRRVQLLAQLLDPQQVGWGPRAGQGHGVARGRPRRKGHNAEQPMRQSTQYSTVIAGTLIAFSNKGK
jgi:hypothetical protein